jgi:nicotinamide/nicotinate riboside kinase
LNEAINYARKNPYKLLLEKDKPLQNNHHGSDLLSYQDFTDVFPDLEELKDVVFIIIEGFLLFCDDKVCDNIDNKYFVNASRHILKERRESREGYVTLQGYWVDPPGYFDQVVWPQFIHWNQHILDDTKRDPSITVLSTDTDSSKYITTLAIKGLHSKYTK